MVGGVDILGAPGGPFFRGRLGYRYARDRLIVGVGPELDARGASLSPELGVKFLHIE